VFIDTAEGYGNEGDIGRALRNTPRDDYFIVTKISFKEHMSENGAKEAVRVSKEKLGVEVLDLVLVHGVMGESIGDRRGMWKALQNMEEEGVIRSWGVSNYEVPLLQSLLQDSSLHPSIIQIPFSPFHQGKQLGVDGNKEISDVVGFCKGKGIVVMGYGLLSNWPFSAHSGLGLKTSF